jgi:methionine-rich copper-binding protein CopC
MNRSHQTLSTLRQFLLSLVVLCFASNALAHAGLEKSIPAANAMMEASPPELVLEFDKPIMLMKLTLADKMNGTAVKLNFTANSKTEKAHKLPLPKLAAGHYIVNWTAMGKDGHNMNGEFAFMIGAMKGMKHDHMKSSSGTNHTGH